MIAIFSTSEVFSTEPADPTQPPTGTLEGRPVYPSGLLLRALSLGYVVHVVSTRSSAEPVDRYWRDLVLPHGKEFWATSTSKEAGWHALYEFLGEPWPTTLAHGPRKGPLYSPMGYAAARLHLRKLGMVLGYEFGYESVPVRHLLSDELIGHFAHD